MVSNILRADLSKENIMIKIIFGTIGPQLYRETQFSQITVNILILIKIIQFLNC